MRKTHELMFSYLLKHNKKQQKQKKLSHLPWYPGLHCSKNSQPRTSCLMMVMEFFSMQQEAQFPWLRDMVRFSGTAEQTYWLFALVDDLWRWVRRIRASENRKNFWEICCDKFVTFAVKRRKKIHRGFYYYHIKVFTIPRIIFFMLILVVSCLTDGDLDSKICLVCNTGTLVGRSTLQSY